MEYFRRLLNETVVGKKRIPVGYKEKANFVFILGMHRSGTSCLAGSLAHCGLFFGEAVRDSRPYNLKGTYELKDAMKVHEQILRASNGSWYQPPSHIAVNRRQKQALEKIAGRIDKCTPCGLKDPRLLLLLDIWTGIVDSYALVATYRHPVAVAQSLARRNQIPEEKAYNLWLVYNAELIRWHKRYHFPIISFDLSNVELYCQAVVAVATTLGLEPDTAQLREFIAPELDHAPPIDEVVPAICQEAYAYLQRHRYRPSESD